MSTPAVNFTITLAPEDAEDPVWRREWMIKFLRGEHAHGDHPEKGKWSMSPEDIVRLFAVFEASGATPEEAESMTCFLPEDFCRKCLDAGGIHLAAESEEDKRTGRRFWIVGTAEATQKWSAEAMDSKVIVDADGNPHPNSAGGGA